MFLSIVAIFFFFIFQALEKHCKASGGYTGIKNVYSTESAKDDVQQSFFLAESLKVINQSVNTFFINKMKLLLKHLKICHVYFGIRKTKNMASFEAICLTISSSLNMWFMRSSTFDVTFDINFNSHGVLLMKINYCF